MHEPGAVPPGAGSVLYPLTVDRLVQLTFSLFRFRWRSFCGLSLAIGLPAYLLVALLQVVVGDDLARVQQAQLDLAAGRPVDLVNLLPVQALAVSCFGIMLVGIAGYFVQAAVVRRMADVYRGRNAHPIDAARDVVSRARPLVAGALLVFLVVFAVIFVGALIGVVLMVATMSGGRIQPGLGVFGGLVVVVGTLALVVFLVVRWSFMAQAVMLERTSAVAALRRSWSLVAGSSWRVLGYTVLFALLIGMVGLLVDTVVTLLFGTGLRLVSGRLVFESVPYIVGSLTNALVALALAPISIIGLTLLYFDLRHRHGEPTMPPETTAELSS